MDKREKVIKGLDEISQYFSGWYRNAYGDTMACEKFHDWMCAADEAKGALSLLKAQEADESKYEYHTDHTDCPWYISGEESKCPVTCSQYRDGWNDAMNYIFRNGDGYRPYDRIRKGR